MKSTNCKMFKAQKWTRGEEIHDLTARSIVMPFSFVGLSGGEIFHEMMLRQGVKHVCR